MGMQNNKKCFDYEQDIGSPYEEDDAPGVGEALQQLSRRRGTLPAAPKAMRKRESSFSRRRMSQLNREELRFSRCSDSLAGNPKSSACPTFISDAAKAVCTGHQTRSASDIRLSAFEKVNLASTIELIGSD